MPHIARLALKPFAAVAVAVALAGCSSGPTVPADQLKAYALLVPKQFGSSIVSEVDGRSPGLSLAGKPVDVRPGRHVIQTYSCYQGSSPCKPDVYTIEVQAGLAYVFRGPSSVEVFDRFKLDKAKLGVLHETGDRVFLSDAEFAQAQQRASAQAAGVQQALLEKRRLDLRLMRRIGARVCQDRGQGVLYIGYVEGLADEKVQIRVADAQFVGAPGSRPAGFSPTIIWDSPLQWDLCE